MTRIVASTDTHTWHYTRTHYSTTQLPYLQTNLAECASSNQLLQHAFWRRHLPESAANTYCKYLTLELKHSRNKQEDTELDKCTEELSYLFQNPCMHLPVRPLHYEEALTATGIAQYVPSRQDLTPFRTPHLCQSLAGNSFHPKLVTATLGGDSHIKNHIRGAQREPSTDSSQVLPPTQVQEHLATKILAPLTENPNTKKQLQELWKTNEERLRTLNPYRHLKLPPRSNGQQPPQPPYDISPIQYGHPDDHEQLYRQAMQRSTAEETHANRQLVPGVLAPNVLDHLITTHSHDLLHALRATRFQNTDKVGLIKQLIGDNIQPMIQDIPGMQAPEQITSLVSALQWWAAQPPDTVATLPTQTVILIHVPSASTPTLLHIGSKQPTSAIYVQQFTEQAAILVGHIACIKLPLQIEDAYLRQPNLARQLNLAQLPAPALRIKESEAVTTSLAVHDGCLIRHAATWDHPLTIQAPAQCVSCHFLAHTTHYTFQPNKGQCSGTALRALYQEALCITATYVSHDTTVPATATVTAVQWAQPAQRGKTPSELPAEIPIIVLARKSHHSGPGPKLHQNITNLIPLRTAPGSGGTPVLPQAQHIHLCGALTPAALHQSDALLLGKAPKILLGDVLWHAANGGHDVPN